MISVYTTVEILRCEDIESLIAAGAPGDEYTPEAVAIHASLVEIKPEDRSKDLLAQIVRTVWSEKFGPFCESDLDLRMPAYAGIGTHSSGRQVMCRRANGDDLTSAT